MVEKVQTEWAKVEECGYETPILRVRSVNAHALGVITITHLAPDKDRPEAVEQRIGRHHAALHQQAGTERSRHPPSRAHGHFEEPLFERKLAHHTAVAAARDHVRHSECGMLAVSGSVEECRGSRARVEGQAEDDGGVISREGEDSCD